MNAIVSLRFKVRSLGLLAVVAASGLAGAQSADLGAMPPTLQKRFADYETWRKSLLGPDAERISSLDGLQQRFERHVRILHSVAPKASNSDGVVLLTAMTYVATLEAKMHDAYLLEQMGLWTTETSRTKNLTPMAVFPLYRTALQAAKLLNEQMLSLELLDTGAEYQKWVEALRDDLRELRRFCWQRATEIEPQGGEWMLRQLGLAKPR